MGRRRLTVVWWVFLGGVVVITFMSWSLRSDGLGDPISWAILVLVGLSDVVFATWYRGTVGASLSRATSEQELRTLYTNRFMVSVSLSASPAVIGLVLAVVSGSHWPGVAGGLVSIAAVAGVGPREGDIAAIDERLVQEGSSLRLSVALDS